MEMNAVHTRQMQVAFASDYNIQLSDEQAQEAIERLSKLFDLLDQFDREDQQKMKTNGEKNYAT